MICNINLLLFAMEYYLYYLIVNGLLGAWAIAEAKMFRP